MALRNLRHRDINPNRHDDPDLLIIAPCRRPAQIPELHPASHHPRLRHVVLTTCIKTRLLDPKGRDQASGANQTRAYVAGEGDGAARSHGAQTACSGARSRIGATSEHWKLEPVENPR